jgi:surface antigen
MMRSFKGFLPARIAAALLVGAAIVSGSLAFAPAAFAGSDDYPAKWKNIPRDSTFDSWGEYNRECTSWVAWRLHGHNQFEMPFHANAADWGAKAKALNYTVNKTPAVGAVAWWDTATRGHVAWVEAVNPNNTVTIEEYNIGSTGKYDEATIAASSPTGYIHFQDLLTSFKDGAYITYGGNVYVMAGGAPLYVTTWAKFGKTPSGLTTKAQWSTLPRYPKNGTFITAQTSRRTYEIVGGAPLYLSSWSIVGGSKPSVVVPDADIAASGTATGVYDHLAYYPTGSTYVVAQPSKLIYQIASGAAQLVTNWASRGLPTPTLNIGDTNIANAGSPTTTDGGHLKGIITGLQPQIWRSGPHGLLRVGISNVKPAVLDLSYQWMRNGLAISGETTATYQPSPAEASAVFTVRVTATHDNYLTQTVVSAPLRPLP